MARGKSSENISVLKSQCVPVLDGVHGPVTPRLKAVFWIGSLAPRTVHWHGTVQQGERVHCTVDGIVMPSVSQGSHISHLTRNTQPASLPLSGSR